MEDKVEERREEVIAELKAALEELEEGEGLSQFIVGHGLMSRLFEFKWSEPTLEINFSLPYARVLTDEDSQKAEDTEIGGAIRMAMLLLTVAGQKKEASEWQRIDVWADNDGTGYAIYDAEWNEIDSGDDWEGLVHRIEATLPGDDETLTIIWP